MYNLTEEQACNFWNYCTFTYPMEMGWYIAMPRWMENINNLHNDEVVKQVAEFLADVINDMNPPEDGENNKAVCIMCMARAYVKFLNDCRNNGRFMNPGSFALICKRIAKNVK